MPTQIVGRVKCTKIRNMNDMDAVHYEQQGSPYCVRDMSFTKEI